MDTLLELLGICLLVAAAGLAFGVPAALAVGGVALLVLGVVLESHRANERLEQATPPPGTRVE